MHTPYRSRGNLLLEDAKLERKGACFIRADEQQ
jgi:hypothetical protein